MKMSNSEIRARAREALGSSIFGRNWMMAILSAIIVGGVIGLANSISWGIATYLLIGPLYVGLHRVFLNIARGNSPEIENNFEGCHNFGSNLVLGLMMNILITLWSLLFVIPGIIKSYAYSIAYFVKCDNPELGWRECLDRSEAMMKGNKWRLFCLQFSFIGWSILGALVCGVGILWVNAYMSTANAVFYEELKREQGIYVPTCTEEATVTE